MSEHAERRVGSVIGGKWRVDSLLGSGSMAAVFAVTHRNGARAALKILHPTLCTDPAVCERFLGEGYLTNSVKHQGIVRVLDDGVTDDGCVFLVMDLLEGKTLEAYRQDAGGEIPLRDILDIADKLMDILQTVHAAGIIHRDMKPQNVFICDDGSVKLLDFGVARVLDKAAQSKLSAFGLVLGTPSFMSPEQALGSRDKVDHRADIWSLGATLFTAITGQTVHLGPHVQAKLLAAATVKARSISMVKQDLPLPIASAIDMALRFKKEDRWQTVEAFRRAFREARAQLGMPNPPSIAPPTPFAESGSFELSLNAPEAATAAAADQDAAVDFNKTVPMDPAIMIANHRPPGPKMNKGPGGTFIGVGGIDKATGRAAALAGASQPPPVPQALRSKPAPAPAPRSAPPRFVPPPPPSESDPHQTEGSYPAVGSTGSALAQLDERRGGGVGVWIATIALVIAAAGGIAFFAVNRATSNARSSVSSAQPPLTSATAPLSTVPAPNVTAPIDNTPAPSTKDASSSVSDSNSEIKTATAKSAIPAAQPPRMTRALRTPTPTPPPPTPAPTPVPPQSQGAERPQTPRLTNDQTQPPAPAQAAAPDPFATPE